MSTPEHDIAHALIEHRGETIRLLKAERDQAREDARVLAEEVRAWRNDKEGDILTHAKLYVPYDDLKPFDFANQVGRQIKTAKTATDASGALERNKP